MRIITDVHSSEAQQLLAAPVFAFDIETSTENVNWKPSHKRGLSYVADMTEVGFYAGEDWVLILSAQGTLVEYVIDEFDRQLDGTLTPKQMVYPATKYSFTADEEAFIRQLFTAENKTIIAHNLIFDARQVFGKFNLEPLESCTYWDTRSIYGLRDKWRYDSTEEGEGDEEGGEGYGSADGSADLYSLYELYVERLPAGYGDFIEFMKGQRKNFPKVDFVKIPPAVVYYLNGLPEFHHATDVLNTHLILQQQKRETPKAKEKKELQAQMDALDFSELIAAMMAHYVTFDIVAPFRIAEKQFDPPKDYPKYPKLLEEDLQYQKFCIDVARRGMRVDRNRAIKKLHDLHTAYQVELQAMGYGNDADDWDRVLKRDFIGQYIFWGNRFDQAGRESKTYSKTVKELIAAAEAAGEQPTNPYPDHETLSAYRFVLLTKNGQKKFAKDIPVQLADFSFGAKALKIWFELYSEMPEIQNLAKLSKLDGSIIFLQMMLRESAYDGRAHTLLGRFADTGRNTSSSPNLQNIHFGGDKSFADPQIIDMAGILVADDGDSVLIELDYSNAENFSAAMISADDNMAYACCAEDFHTARARFFFGADVMDGLTPDERKKKRAQAKTVGFGEGYGMGAAKLAVSLGTTVEEAKALLELSAQAFPDLAAAKDAYRTFADKNGWVQTWTGRRNRIPTKWNENSGRVEFSSYTNGWNSPNQGGVAEIVCRAINQIRSWLLENGYKTRILSQVHDSLIVNLYLDEYPFVVQKIIQIMGSILDGVVRWKAKGDEPEITWNNSTNPPIRWLVDLDNIGNAKKWGYEEGRGYPLPIREYVNTWGVHQLTDAEYESAKAPTWINSFGYGEDALKREMAGGMGVELDLPEPVPQREDFHWAKLQHCINQVVPLLGPMTYNGQILDFPNAMALRQLQYQRGESNDFPVIQEQLDKLTQVMSEYKDWLTS